MNTAGPEETPQDAAVFYASSTDNIHQWLLLPLNGGCFFKECHLVKIRFDNFIQDGRDMK
jgi:hypothetical protein